MSSSGSSGAERFGRGSGGGGGRPFDPARVGSLYRQVATAVVSSYLGLEDAFVDAVLEDRAEAFLDAAEPERERLKAERYDEYLSLLARETVVSYAGGAAEELAREPEVALAARPRRQSGGSGPRLPRAGDPEEVGAVVRVHEMCELLEVPDETEGTEGLLFQAKRQLCDYYNACAFDLVKGPLLPVIVTAADMLYRDPKALDACGVRALIIAGQERRAA